MLATFIEEPNSRTLSLISSTIQVSVCTLAIDRPHSQAVPSLLIQGIDLYFKRNELLGLQPLSALPSAFAAPMPGSAPPPPYGGAGPSGGPGVAGPQQQSNIFQRFTDRVATLGYTLPDIFAKHDVDKSGQLTQNQVRS